MTYEPSEDSFLLGKYVSKFSKGRVLEIGVGSGYLMEIALKKNKNVFGVDIDDDAVKFCKNKKLNIVKSDLFSNVKGKFDFIIFNPPYLPEDEIKDKDLIGGKHGWEIIEKFFSEVGKHLNKNGEILIVFSNLTDKSKVDKIVLKNGFKFELLEEKSVGLMERLFVYKVHR